MKGSVWNRNESINLAVSHLKVFGKQLDFFKSIDLFLFTSFDRKKKILQVRYLKLKAIQFWKKFKLNCFSDLLNNPIDMSEQIETETKQSSEVSNLEVLSKQCVLFRSATNKQVSQLQLKRGEKCSNIF